MHLEGLLQRARTPERRAELLEQLEGAPLPPAAIDAWRTFVRIHSRRSSSGMGVSRITWPDIDAFERVNRRRLAPWEIQIIEACDDAFMASQGSKSDAPKGEPAEAD